MIYDLEVIIQAFAIACDECVEDIPEDMGHEPAFRRIVAYCDYCALRLLRQAAKELNERRRKAAPSGTHE